MPYLVIVRLMIKNETTKKIIIIMKQFSEATVKNVEHLSIFLLISS